MCTSVAMGIRLLNSFINSSRSSGIQEIALEELEGKKVVVDASIYLYRFKAAGSLIESLFLMCSVLRSHNIHILFIFDGQPPPHKRAAVDERRRNKERAEAKRARLMAALEVEENERIRDDLKREIARITKKCARLSRRDIAEAKTLLDSYGIGHLQASGEADGVCAAMVVQGRAYACISEDTDLFMYGCPRVLKYLSLAHHTAMLYSLDTLLKDLELPLARFRQLCALSGTDYHKTEHSIFDLYRHFHEYEASCTNDEFEPWLSRRLGVHLPDLTLVLRHYVSEGALAPYKYKVIRNGDIDYTKLHSVLREARFVFAPARPLDCK